MIRHLLLIGTAVAYMSDVGLSADKPRTRVNAEDRDANLARYVRGGFGANATATLGVKVKYVDGQQGATIVEFEADSTAQNAGLKPNDIILEVDGAAVGLIRNRYYELWPQYGRSGSSLLKYLSEVLVTFVHSEGDRRYYYPVIPTQRAVGAAPGQGELDPGFFTAEKPATKELAETKQKNVGRYVYGAANFETFGKFELGTTVLYSYEAGATIQTIKNGSPAQNAGLKVGDHILETAGARNRSQGGDGIWASRGLRNGRHLWDVVATDQS